MNPDDLITINDWDTNTGCGTSDGTYTSYTTESSMPVQTVTVPSTGYLTFGTVGGGGGGSAGIGGLGGYPSSIGVHYPNAGNIYPNSNVVIDNAALLITYGGKQINVGQAISMLMERLCMIEPSFHLHEKYPALKEAYDAYRAIEAMCKAGDKQEDDQI